MINGITELPLHLYSDTMLRLNQIFFALYYDYARLFDNKSINSINIFTLHLILVSLKTVSLWRHLRGIFLLIFKFQLSKISDLAQSKMIQNIERSSPRESRPKRNGYFLRNASGATRTQKGWETWSRMRSNFRARESERYPKKILRHDLGNGNVSFASEPLLPPPKVRVEKIPASFFFGWAPRLHIGLFLRGV